MKSDWKTSEFLTLKQADELFEAEGGAYLEQALKEGLNPQMPVNSGYNFLSLFGYALHNRLLNAAETMLKADEKLIDSVVCWTSRNKDSALMYAVGLCDFSLVELLFRHGLDARSLSDNVMGRICSSAYYQAEKRQEQSKIIHFLIDKGCSVNKLDYAGKTVLMTYLSNLAKTDIGVVDKIGRMQSWDINQPSMGLNKTVSHIAAQYGKTEALAHFLNNYIVNLDAVDMYGYTPLCVAVMNGKEKEVELLVRAGSDVNAVDCAGRSILEHACCGYQNTLEENYKNRHGMKNIHQSAITAAYKTQKRIIQLLIQQGADVHCPTANSRPLISEVLAADNLGIAKLLLDAGANLEDIDKNGESVMDSIANEPQKLAFIHKMRNKQKRDSLKKNQTGRRGNVLNELKEQNNGNYLMGDQNVVSFMFDKSEMAASFAQTVSNIQQSFKIYKKMFQDKKSSKEPQKTQSSQKLNKNARAR